MLVCLGNRKANLNFGEMTYEGLKYIVFLLNNWILEDRARSNKNVPF